MRYFIEVTIEVKDSKDAETDAWFFFTREIPDPLPDRFHLLLGAATWTLLSEAEDPPSVVLSREGGVFMYYSFRCWMPESRHYDPDEIGHALDLVRAEGWVEHDVYHFLDAEEERNDKAKAG